LICGLLGRLHQVKLGQLLRLGLVRIEQAIELGALVTSTLLVDQGTALLKNVPHRRARFMQQRCDNFNRTSQYLGRFVSGEGIDIAEHECDVLVQW
jgi:hypothetical protein